MAILFEFRISRRASRTRRTIDNRTVDRRCRKEVMLSSQVTSIEGIRIGIKMNLITRQCLRILQGNVKNQRTSYNLRTSTFKSALSLENFYPESTLKLHTPTFVSIYWFYLEILESKIDSAHTSLLLFIINNCCSFFNNITSMLTEWLLLVHFSGAGSESEVQWLHTLG